MSASDFASMNVAQLRDECRNRGLKGFSGLNRAQLQAYVDSGNRPAVFHKPGSCPAMKAECKSKGLKGYSKLGKAHLQDYLATGVRPVVVARPGTVDHYREWLRKANVVGRSRAKTKSDLLALCIAHNLISIPQAA